jgi:hypothetical protein
MGRVFLVLVSTVNQYWSEPGLRTVSACESPSGTRTNLSATSRAVCSYSIRDDSRCGPHWMPFLVPERHRTSVRWMIGVNHPCENAVVYTASPSSLHTTSTVCAARIQPRLAVPGDATWFGDGNIWDLPGLAVKRGIARSGSKGASMPTDTAAVIKRFNNAFLQHDPDKLVDLIGDDCVMESAQPAPNGTRYEGYDACLGFWREQIADPNGSFGPEEVVVSGDRATIRCAASTSCTSGTGRSWRRSDT